MEPGVTPYIVKVIVLPCSLAKLVGAREIAWTVTLLCVEVRRYIPAIAAIMMIIAIAIAAVLERALENLILLALYISITFYSF